MEYPFFDRLEARLREPLPGLEAQYKLAHKVRQQPADPGPDARIASVLALFYPDANDWNIALIQRVSTERDQHSGQISFPGGKQEPDDPSLAFTALREAEEEIGVSPQDVTLLGSLSPLFIPVSNFLVHPFVGHISYRPDFTLQTTEVADLVELPLPHLLDPSIIGTTDIPISSRMTLREVPFFDVHGKVVWGATAMILSELKEVLPL
ncbi:MAG: CoA pyrophosphatase [Bacteroidota bacterium]